MIELKPCPFCGGKVFLRGSSSNREFIFYHKYPRNCHFYSFEMDWQTVKTLDEAAKAWNRRTDND